MLSRRLFALAFGVLLGSLALGQESPENEQAQEIEAYDSGRFSDAIRLAKARIVENPDNGHLYYNLGNAYFRNGQRGKAVAAYLQARKLLPRDPDIRANLAFAIAQNPDSLESSLAGNVTRNLLFWIDSITVKEMAYAAAYFFGLGCILILIATFLSRGQSVRIAGYAAGGTALALTVALTVSLSLDESWGAVTSPLAEVKSGPGDGNAVVFELSEGAPFVARARENSWYQIEISDGKIGWISAAQSTVYAF